MEVWLNERLSEVRQDLSSLKLVSLQHFIFILSSASTGSTLGVIIADKVERYQLKMLLLKSADL